MIKCSEELSCMLIALMASSLRFLRPTAVDTDAEYIIRLSSTVCTEAHESTK